jgi:hypothetical protein
MQSVAVATASRALAIGLGQSPVTSDASNGAPAAEDGRREFFACGLDFFLAFFYHLAENDHSE